MSLEENKWIARRFISEVLERQRQEVVDELIDKPILASNVKTHLGEVAAVISELHYRIDHVVAEGDDVAVFCSILGKHSGEFPGPTGTLRPTGRDVVIEEAYRFRIVNGKIDTFVTVTDLMGLFARITS